MFVRCIAKRYPQVSFRICTSSAYARPFEKLTNIGNLGYWGRLVDRVCKKITDIEICKRYLEQTAKATVHIGGSVFIEPDHFSVPKNYYSNPNLYMIGCNFGPYKTDTYRDFIYSRLQKARDVCFRDKYSYEMFSSLAHVRVAPDVLLGYPDYPKAQVGYGVGISVISLDERQDLKHVADTYYSVIAQVVDAFVQMKIPVKLFSFCTDEGDSKAIEHILEQSKTKEAEICTYDGDIDAILDQINECEYIIATRFHAMIIGWCLSKKVLPVVYSDKQIHVMDDMEYRKPYWDLRIQNEYNYSELMEDMYTAHSHDVKKYQSHSLCQFKRLDKYFSDMCGN